MARTPTKKEAEGALFNAINTFDWVKFLDKKKEFLQNYRALSAQLRDGDELLISVRRIEEEVHQRSVVHSYPLFELILHQSDGLEVPVTNSRLLYD